MQQLLLKFKWPILAVIVLILNYIFRVFPILTEKVYFGFIYQVWRVIYDYSFGLLPFGTVYLLFFALFPILYFIFIKPWQSKAKGMKTMMLRMVNLLSVVIILFYVLWGYNYNREKLAVQLGLSQVDSRNLDLKEEIESVIGLLYAIRSTFKSDNLGIHQEDVPENLLANIREDQEEILQSWSFPTFGRVQVRKLVPKGILLRISTAGVYIPFVSEGHIDKGLHPIQWPFTLAHEMGHGYGFTDEGECNFIAFVTCMNSGTPFIKYSGMMGYFRYLLSNYRRYYPQEYNDFLATFPYVILKDLQAIDAESKKYPDILPDVRDAVYDQYLRSHGVKEGLASYSTIIKLIHQWRNSNYNRELATRTFPSLLYE